MTSTLPQTELNLPDVAGIDTWDDERILEALWSGQQRAVDAVRRALPKIGATADVVADRLRNGGKLIYAGAGTSIRIAVQDGSELPATFGMREEQIGYLIAGNRDAMFETLAAAEDDTEDARRQAAICEPGDVVIAIAASGATPFTVAAAKTAKERQSFVVAVVNSPGSALALIADVEILLESGPEVISGSTRMGAGTAQKAALNLLSTLVHIKLGAVHDGMMVNVQAGNQKLIGRVTQIVSKIAGCDLPAAAAALSEAGGQAKLAILICAGAKSPGEACKILDSAGGNLRLALSRVRSQ